jgi:hypothetical protein
MPHGGLLSTADYDKNEWEIMYPCFVEEGLVDPSEHVNRKRLMLHICVLIESIFFCFAHDVLFAFACMFVFCFIFRYFVTGVCAPRLQARSMPAFERLLVCLL